MHLTKLCEARPERAAGWGTQPLTDLSWLIDADLGASDHGAVARMTIEAGGGQEPHRHPGSEEVTLVLEGDGTALVDGAWRADRGGQPPLRARRFGARSGRRRRRASTCWSSSLSASERRRGRLGARRQALLAHHNCQ